MQIAIEIPDELVNHLEAQGKPLNLVIIEALGLYVQHDRSVDITRAEIDWEQWFAELESLPMPTPTQHPPNEFTALLIEKYRKQGLKL
jgi:hypothetical protein